MHYQPFYASYPKIAEKETRVITFLTNEKIPIGSYAIVPSFCVDKTCDCRRALINVIEDKPEAIDKPLATISYGWEEFSFYKNWANYLSDDQIAIFKGPVLDTMQPQSEHAPFLLKTFIDIIKNDVDYYQRLQRHYAYFKHKKGMHLPLKLKKLMQPLALCPCESGKIFKLCCGKVRSRIGKGKRRKR